MILACYGLLQEYNKKILAVIVFLDLLYLLTNYVFLFLQYQTVKNLIGETFYNILYKLSLFIGFDTTSYTNLWQVFIFHLVIFYFSVETYRLKDIINDNRFDEEGRVLMDYLRKEQYNDDEV